RAFKPDGFPFALLMAFNDPANAIDVALDEMSAQAVGRAQRPFQIDAVVDLKLAEIGAHQCLGSELKINAVVRNCDGGQTASIHRNALTYGDLAAKGCTDR